MNILRIRICLIALHAIILTSCVQVRETTIPIPAIYHDEITGDACTLLVYLPGNGDSPDAFAYNGLIMSLRSQGLNATVVDVDAHLGYYSDNTLVARLKEDVINPAKSRGFRNIWLVGNSLGGVGSLMYVKEHEKDIAGVVLLDPFVGDKEIIKEIRRAGGLQKWDPGSIRETDWQRKLLVWLKEYGRSGHSSPPLYLGYGTDDRFATGQELLAGMLPPERVVAIYGGHDWRTWSAAWKLLVRKFTFTPCDSMGKNLREP
jgi:pimeloyl-ACP methyl ester carboxylesterase